MIATKKLLKKGFFIFLFGLLSLSGFSQATDNDTTIYQVVREMPRFPGCEELDTTLQAKDKCAQQVLLSFIYQNIIYPFEARQNGNEGTVVVSFVVEKDGQISQDTIMKDIGGGCGAETIRVLRLLNPSNIRFIPGKKDGKAVRVRMTVPVRFRLEELPPYVVNNGDSIWVQVETPLEYTEGREALSTFLNDKLNYPESGLDSCLVGNIDVQIKVDRAGAVSVLDMTDYCNLGFDFWFETTNAVTATYGKWDVATYEGKAVPSVYEISIPFRPTNAACQTKVNAFDQANVLANEAVELYAAEKEEEAIQKLSEAIQIFPYSASYYYLRGQIYVNRKEFEQACADLQQAKEIAQIKDFDGVMTVICR